MKFVMKERLSTNTQNEKNRIEASKLFAKKKYVRDAGLDTKMFVFEIILAKPMDF
jgi:hypothetical protein